MASIDQLLEIMDRLRDPSRGCPWDREQTFRSIVPHTLEETYEVTDAIERERFDQLPDELGDLLFQVVFYARLGKERGWFSFDTVVKAICRKLIERHPHVFAGAVVAGSEELSLRWEQAKAQRRRDSSGEGGTLDGITLGLPAMTRAAKLQRRAASAGFDWPAMEPVLDKVAEELNELRAVAAEDLSAREAEMGDLLFSCVNAARHLGIDPEQALRGANRRFEERFRYVEARLRAEGREAGEASLAELDALWEEAKRNGQ